MDVYIAVSAIRVGHVTLYLKIITIGLHCGSNKLNPIITVFNNIVEITLVHMFQDVMSF